MAKQQRQEKDSAAARDETSSRHPAWREQAPAHPRKRVKRKQMAVPASSGRAVGPGRSGGASSRGRGLALPSRETWSAILRIAALLLTAIAVTAGLIYLLRLPELTVGPSSTAIGGNERITKEAIYAGSGIDGRNILLLRSAVIVDQVKLIPGIEKAAVHLRLPNQVIIDIREHSPLVAWQGITETVWLAADGAAVPQTGAKPPLSFADLSNGKVTRDAALHTLLLDNLNQVHAARPALTEFFYADEPGLYYRAPEGWDVWLGESGPMSDKLALADATGQDIARQGGRAKVVDVRQSEHKALWW